MSKPKYKLSEVDCDVYLAIIGKEEFYRDNNWDIYYLPTSCIFSCTVISRYLGYCNGEYQLKTKNIQSDIKE